MRACAALAVCWCLTTSLQHLHRSSSAADLCSDAQSMQLPPTPAPTRAASVADPWNPPAAAPGEGSSPTAAAVPAPRVMLLCGADLVESFATPGVWRREHLQQILGPDHGVVCIAR